VPSRRTCAVLVTDFEPKESGFRVYSEQDREDYRLFLTALRSSIAQSVSTALRTFIEVEHGQRCSLAPAASCRVSGGLTYLLMCFWCCENRSYVCTSQPSLPSKLSDHINMGALEFICDRRFHRSFVVPANPESNTSKPYHVSYSDFGDADSKAIVLFCGALFGQRLCYAPLDQLAKAHHVRIIHPDRPGVGGSEAVEPEKRVQTWLGKVNSVLLRR
jgi:hypothetical protein